MEGITVLEKNISHDSAMGKDLVGVKNDKKMVTE